MKESLKIKARFLRKNATPQENKLWYQFLCNHPSRFRRQHPIGNYILDFYCVKMNLAIEIDGSGHYEPDQKEYDKYRTEYLNSQGITVLRFQNNDITKHFDSVCRKIDIAVKPPPPPAGGTSPAARGR